MVYDSQNFFDSLFLSYNKILLKLKALNITTKDGREISYRDLVQAINIMVKKHATCGWKGRVYKNNKCYILTEGVEWLAQVYFQKEKSMLKADVNFFENRISEYEKLLNIEYKKTLWDKSMTVKELAEYFWRDISAIRKAVRKMCSEGYPFYKHYQDGKVIIDSFGIEWLCKNVFQHKYLELLEDYKMELTWKYKKAGYPYDNYFRPAYENKLLKKYKYLLK